MAAPATPDRSDDSVDPTSGFCHTTKIFHSLRPPAPLPPADQPLTIVNYATDLLRSSPTVSDLSSATFLVDAATGDSLTYATFLRQTRALSLGLKRLYPSLSPNDVAFVVCPSSSRIPVLYFALMSIGVTISPSNPLSSQSELAHQIQLTKPKLAFATSQTASKLPSHLIPLGTFLIDSSQFQSLLTVTEPEADIPVPDPQSAVVTQSDTAAILYSSGTTGKVKGVRLSHRNVIALTSGFYHNRREYEPGQPEPHPVALITVPLFHVFGFFMLVKGIAIGETMVLMQRFDFEGMLRAVEKYRVTYMPVSPPLIVAMLKSELTNKYDLSSLLVLGCGGAPLGKDVAEKFKEKFPNVDIIQGYGLTESMGGGTRMIDAEESKHHGSAGKLSENLEAKVVDPETGEGLGPEQRGEIWLRGPVIMQGYVGNEKATAETLDPDGWLKTGDLGYFNSQGHLYIVDRLKELIKYKAYQVPPVELEQLLQSNPKIADAAVIPYPDEDAGQIPMAFVVRKPGFNLTESEVMEFVAKQVAPYKRVRRVAFVNSIPKSPAGKILRRELVNIAVSAPASKL
ncbi:4-coumarate--CoA ligase-like 9 [Linum grandiflorum]